MEVSLVCFGMLKDYLPPKAESGRVQLTLHGAPSVRELVISAGLPIEKIFAILVDGRQVSLDHTLNDGAEVTFMPQFTGGSSAFLPHR